MFGNAAAVRFLDKLDDVEPPRHALSWAINGPLNKKVFNFIVEQPVNKVPNIINLGVGATTLAATPPVEPFSPYASTYSGNHSGMGHHLPIEVAAPQCPKNDESKFIDMFNGFNGKSVILLDQVHRVNEELKSSPFLMKNYCVYHRKSLKGIKQFLLTVISPTITSRPLGGAQIKATLMIPLRDDPLYIRLTNEDTSDSFLKW